jgi:hypothetical protein
MQLPSCGRQWPALARLVYRHGCKRLYLVLTAGLGGLSTRSNATWFKLIGAIAKDRYAPIEIGSGLTDFSPTTSGQLFCFANDIAWMYWNKRGSIQSL